MALMKYNPVQSDNNVLNFFDGFFDDDAVRQLHHITPASEVAESNDAYHIKLALPGMRKEQINIELDNQLLSISADYNRTEEEGIKVHSTDFRYGKYEKTFTLPKDIVTDKVDAHFDNGILLVNIPKSEQSKPRTIKVK